MKVIKGNSVQKVYGKLVRQLFKRPIVGNTKEINNCVLVIKNPSIKDYHLPYKKVSQDYCINELKWYWSADNSCETIGKHAKMWLALTDDGKTNNSAYGYILFKKYGFNQLEQIIELLRKDNNTRRAVLNISDPAINRIKTKDMQCTIGLQFLIRNGALEETVYMRSNDVNFGFPFDYMFFMTIGEYIANRLNIKLKLYTHHATSMHMYLKDEKTLKKNKNNDVVVNIDTDDIIKCNYKGDAFNEK